MSSVFCLAILLTVLVERASAALTIMVKPYYSFTSTDNTLPQYMKLLVSGAASSYEYTAGDPVSCFATTSYNSPNDQLKCFKLDGTVAVTYSPSPSMFNVYSLAQTDGMKITMAGALSGLGLYTMTASGATYTLSSVASYPLSLSASGSPVLSAAVYESGTNYVYFGPSAKYLPWPSPNFRQYRMDISATSGTALTGYSSSYAVPATASGSTAETYKTLLYGTKLVNAGTYKGLCIVDKTTLAQDSFASLTYGTNTILFNNIAGSTSILYYSYVSTSTTDQFIIEYDMSSSAVGRQVLLATSVKVAANFFNFGTLAYLGIMKVNSVGISVINKATFSGDEIVIPAPNLVKLPAASNFATIAYVGFDAYNYWATITFSNKIGTSPQVGSSFTSLKLLMNDVCTSRDDATGLCSSCPTSPSKYFKSDTSNYNYCILPAHFPAGYGGNVLTQVMTACGTGCTSCLNDIRICSVCNTGATYVYVYTSATDVYCSLPASTPAAYGIDRPTNVTRVVPCGSGCTNCRGDIRICEVCNTGGGYIYKYDSATAVSCVLTSSLPISGYGIDHTNRTKLTTCNTGCLSCTNDIDICSSCDTGYNYLYDSATSVSCILTSAPVPTGYGIDHLNRTKIAPCNTGCLSCTNDIDICSSCDTGYSYLYNSATSVSCVLTSSLPLAGKGIDHTNRTKVSPCGTGCTSCDNDLLICSTCNTASYRYLYTSATDVTCVSTGAAVPSGFGIDHNNRTKIAPCNTGCLSCTNDIDICSSCDTGYSYLYNSATDVSCVLTSSLPLAGKGIDHTNRTKVTSCGTGCTSCDNDLIICKVCNTPTYTYIFNSATDVYCAPTSSIPSGYGIDRITNSSRAITCPTGCQLCNGDTRICSQCDTGSGYVYKYTSATDVVCIPSTSIPAGWGRDPAVNNTKVVRCPTGCQSCTNDLNICSTCDTGSGYIYLYQSPTQVSCIMPAAIPAKYGYDSTNATRVMGCSEPGCISCSADKDVCTACDTYYSFNNNKCTMVVFDVVEKSFDSQTKSIKLRFEVAISLSSMYLNTSDIRIDLFDEVKPTSRLLEGGIAAEGSDVPFEMQVLPGGDGHIYKLILPKNAYGEYSKARISSRSRNFLFFSANIDSVFPGFDIDVEGILIMDNSTTNWTPIVGMGRVLQWILKLINFSFKVLLMPLDFFLSSFIDRHTAFFSFLRVLDGPYLIQPGYLINEMSSVTFFGFTIPNPHTWANNPNCKPPGTYKDNGLQCNAFANYGQNVNILWGALFLSGSVFLVCKFVLKPLFDKEWRKNKFVEILDDNFGLKYFYLFMDGVSLELSGLAILNLVNIHRGSGSMAGGGVLSIIILLYYIGFYALLGYATKNTIEAKRSGTSTENEAKGSWLKSKADYLTFMTQEYKKTQMSEYFYYMPVVYGAKNLLVQIIAIALVGSGFGQLVPILILEVAYLGLLAVGRVKSNLFNNIYDIAFQSLISLVIILKLVSVDKNTLPSTRQNKVGVGLATVLLMIVYITTFYVFTRIAQAVKKQIELFKNSKLNKVDSLDNLQAQLEFMRSKTTPTPVINVLFPKNPGLLNSKGIEDGNSSDQLKKDDYYLEKPKNKIEANESSNVVSQLDVPQDPHTHSNSPPPPHPL